MTELSIRPEEIRDALQKYVEDYHPEAASKEEVGAVTEAGDARETVLCYQRMPDPDEEAMLRKLDVKWDMLEEWSRTKRAPKHAAFAHQKELAGQ